MGLATLKGDASCLSNAALEVVSNGFTKDGPGRRAVLSPHLALVADVAATTPLRSSALKSIFRCFDRRGRMEVGVEGGGLARCANGGVALSEGCNTLEGGDRR